MSDNKSETRRRFVSSLKIPAYFIIALLIIHVFQFITGGGLSVFGIYPRHPEGLIGIITAPLIHGDLRHLFSNAMPLFALTAMLFFFYRTVAFQSFVLIYLFTGVAVWLFARSVFHIGASGVVYGLVSFVFWTGIFRRNLKSIVLALIVTLVYSGYIIGIFPNQEGISWESHLFGAIVGIIIAYLFRNQVEMDELPNRYSWEDEESEETEYFLPRDAFEKTKNERKTEEIQKRSGWISDSTWEDLF